jgi:hypothetical protein
MEPKYPEIEVQLTGEDGNAFSIMGRVVEAMREAKVPQDEITKFTKECMSGDYANLLATCTEWVTCD